jgi:serine/threonine protein kinase/WD40 repeat protein
MNPQSPSADEIFERASQLSGEARAAYLKEVTGGDEPLRQRIEALLQAGESAGTTFLKEPAVSAKTLFITTNMLPVTEKAGDKIGRYKLLEQIGEGGCGVVYVAEQQEPVRRRVALKVIKLGMDTRQVVARFEAERQALALMDHPNIAKVLDAGATETGRPYFVMELVRGIKITDYCDKNNLSTAERLKLFISVCAAVQHAHQKGIIHRDLKPSNILVTLHDGVPVPKVIDFGIAKATTDQRLTDKTIYTAFEQFIGTPAYMSPEQAEMSGLDIDTRSDIYSLGVLLYELLTSRTPFDTATLLKDGLDQMRRILREQEPPRPSISLNTLTDADLTTVASHRRAEPPKLAHLIRGDLDWIVMKALEKDRTRRYETVNGLAADVQRHLSSEPVTARAPSQLYRLQKAVHRNRLAFAAALVITGLLLAGVAVSSWQAVLKSREARRADSNAAQANLQTQRAEAAAQDARQALARSDFLQAAELEKQGKMTNAIAYLQRSLSLNPSNAVAATRLIMLASQRAGMIPVRIAGDGPEFSPDGKRIVTTLENTARVWDAHTGQQVMEINNSNNSENYSNVVSAAFSPDGKRIVSVSWVNGVFQVVQVWDAQTGQQVTEWKHPGDYVVNNITYNVSAQFSADGKRIVTVGGNMARVWDAQTGQQMIEMKHPDLVISAQVSPDEKRIVTASGNTARLWDAQSGAVLAALEVSATKEVQSVQFSPDGKRIVTASGNTARVWDAQTGQQMIEMKHPDNLFSAQFSPDEKRIVTASLNTARVWDAQTGQQVMEMYYSNESLIDTGNTSAQFSPDGKWIHTESTKVDLWDAQTGQQVAAIDSQWPAQFSPDGKRIITVLYDEAERNSYAVRVRDIPPYSTNYPDWLLTLTEALSGQVLNRQGVMEPLAQDTHAVLNQLRQKLNALPDNDDWTIWGRWLLADHWTRPISPYAKITLAEYIEQRLREPSDQSFAEVEPLAAGNADLLRRIAETRSQYERTNRPTVLLAQADNLMGQKKFAEAEPIVREALELQRKLLGNENEHVAVSLERLADTLLHEQKFVEAEPFARECVTFCEKSIPDNWVSFSGDVVTFEARCVLGGSLLGQKKYAEAEPFLKSGYEGIKARKDKEDVAVRLQEAGERLVQLYEATGRPAEAAALKKELPASK